MNAAEYERQERVAFYHQCRDAILAPLADRRGAEREVLALMKDTDSLERAAFHALAGNYGKGAHLALETIMASRGNRQAMFMQHVAICTSNCPPANCRNAWKSLTTVEQKAVAEVLTGLIEQWCPECRGPYCDCHDPQG